MLVEAMRAHLVSLGILEAATWTNEYIMSYINSTLLQCSEEDPESFDEVLTELWDSVKETMLTVNKVLSEETQDTV
jgi:hypothetical protein